MKGKDIFAGIVLIVGGLVHAVGSYWMDILAPFGMLEPILKLVVGGLTVFYGAQYFMKK